MKKLFHELPALAITMTLLLPGLFLQGTVHAFPADAKKAEQAGDAAEKGSAESGERDEAKPRIFGIDGGYNGSYAEGTSPKNFYSQPYLNISLKNKYIKFTAGISRFWDFQISNGAGAYETVNFTQPKLALSVYPHDVIEIYGSYLYSAGDKTHYYRVHDWSGGFFLDFEVVSLGFTGDYKKTEYVFKSDDRSDYLSITPGGTANPYINNLIMMARYKNFKIQNIKHLEDYTLTPAFSWFFIESTSLDLAYDYMYSDFNNPYSFKSIYPKQNEHIIFYSHSGKIGITSETCEYFTLMAAFSSGWSNDDVITVGGEIEGIINLFDYANISITYAPVYNISPKMDPLTRKFYEYRSYVSLFKALRGRRLNINPFMQLKNIGKNFWSHGVSFNVSFRY
ncbi:MAG TPA: hypothetical protein PLM53_03465 [Spirochaetota bacterium]|nr:hypothetical protein [Spirochaetota bacterium]HPC40292.1 hypothetical protein [Spirochaetota bacterium]HPL15335.1 hypothetical protein [Spirochaetota bacterium]HQF07234.1 hypothetical protein [Spirochaetota bacterium]HQH96134.1 hypothetical protein [Spirochaetota bacterium]